MHMHHARAPPPLRSAACTDSPPGATVRCAWPCLRAYPSREYRPCRRTRDASFGRCSTRTATPFSGWCASLSQCFAPSPWQVLDEDGDTPPLLSPIDAPPPFGLKYRLGAGITLYLVLVQYVFWGFLLVRRRRSPSGHMTAAVLDPKLSSRSKIEQQQQQQIFPNTALPHGPIELNRAGGRHRPAQRRRQRQRRRPHRHRPRLSGHDLFAR